MFNEDELVVLNFTKILTTPSSTITFNETAVTVEPNYLSLDALSEQVLILARESDFGCQNLLMQIVIDKFNNGEFDLLLDLNQVIS